MTAVEIIFASGAMIGPISYNGSKDNLNELLFDTINTNGLVELEAGKLVRASSIDYYNVFETPDQVVVEDYIPSENTQEVESTPVEIPADIQDMITVETPYEEVDLNTIPSDSDRLIQS